MLDTSVPLELDLMPKYFHFSGQLRFQSEDAIDEYLDDIKFRVNGTDHEIKDGDIEEVDFEPTFRTYKLWIKYDVFKEFKDYLEVVPYSTQPDSNLIFKPPIRVQEHQKKEPERTSSVNFKVVEGMFVQGQVHPPVANVTVSIQREN